MSPGERAALGRRDAPRPHYAATAAGFPPPYYPPYGVPPHPNAWLGAPLISMTGRTPPPRDNPVSKLAMHAQGAPLIIQNRHDRRKYTTVPEQRNHRTVGPMENIARDRCDPENTRHRNQQQQQQTRPSRSGRNNNTDAVSVASDESSGSTNSETMLPRIIKPRKRRKKDRKPNNLVPHDLTSGALDLGDVEHCTNMGSSSHGIYEKSYSRDMALQYSLNVKVFDYPDPAPETYRVAALGEAFEATRFGLAEAASPSESAVSSCQCRYCDPVGQIWDANSIAHLLDENSSVDFAPTKLEDSMKVVGPLGRRGADTVLRRSWSDPSARIPEGKANNSEAFSAPNLYSLFPPPRRTSSPEPRSPLALEISSEIVTSINGHRDLEIKLFSTSPSASTSERRSFFDDKSESAVNDRSANAKSELKSNSAVSCEKVASANNVKKSVNVDSGCMKALGAGENSRNICTAYFSPNVTATLPPQRPWIPLTRPNRSRPTCIFTVMCYNVLCDKYATRQMYGYCPSWALEWDYRKKGILDEIRHYSADIISLQEVETDQFYAFFLPELKQDGYDGIFSPKSRAKTMSESERKYVDGCAIFFRSSKFSLVKEHLIEFNQLAMANSEGSDNMLNRVMPKDNIGLAALLKTKEAAWENAFNDISGIPTDTSTLAQPILVCTAHIHWDPEFCDVKLIQTMMLSNELRSILDDSARTLRMTGQKDNVQLLLCGDFNSLPDSGVIEFLSAGRVSADHRDFKALGYAGSLRRMPGSEHEFTHNFKLASAYSEDIMPYTNYTFDFKGIIDYIFYSKQSMTPLGLLGPLSQDWFREHKVVGCPHPHIPSDHFPLLVELEMCPSSSGNSNGLIGRR